MVKVMNDLSEQPFSISKLRANLYQVIDRVLETGEPVVVERHGRRVRLVPDAPHSKLASLEPHPDYLNGDPDDIVHMDWSGEWHPFL
jgi:prevent-host-death family protein